MKVIIHTYFVLNLILGSGMTGNLVLIKLYHFLRLKIDTIAFKMDYFMVLMFIPFDSGIASI